MEEKIKGWKAAASAAAAVLTTLWGWFGWLMIAWIVCMALDVFTGMAVGIKKGEWSSKTAREGLGHKIGCVAAVAVSGILDMVVGQILKGLPQFELPFEYTVLLCPMVTVWYILTEAGSIIENAGDMGAPIPIWLKRAVASLREHVDEKG